MTLTICTIYFSDTCEVVMCDKYLLTSVSIINTFVHSILLFKTVRIVQ